MDDIRERLYRHYAQHSRPPESLAGLRSREPHLRALVRRHFPNDHEARILDLGCGYGALVHFARQEGYPHVRGVDGARDQVEAAATLGIEGVEHGDLMDALRRTPAASVDVAIAFDVLEHFDTAELLRFVDEVHRVLRPSGRWLIHVPNGESPFFGRVRYGDLTHRTAFTATSLRQLLEASGFSRVDLFEDLPVPHGVKSFVRAVLWRVIRGALRLYLAVETGNNGRGAIFTQNLLAVAYRAAARENETVANEEALMTRSGEVP